MHAFDFGPFHPTGTLLRCVSCCLIASQDSEQPEIKPSGQALCDHEPSLVDRLHYWVDIYIFIYVTIIYFSTSLDFII